MGLKQVLKPVKGVLENPELDTAVAPSLGKVYQYLMGKYEVESPVDKAIMEVYGDPARFFEETYITEGMEEVFHTVLSALTRGEGGVILLPSVFGGGKTHILIALIHGLLNPLDIARADPPEKASSLSKQVANFGGLKWDELIVIDGEYGGMLAPSPVEPLHAGAYTIRTLWGLMGYLLGRYELVKKYDEEAIAPHLGTLIELFKGKRVVILIDELAEYVLRLPETENIREKYWEQILRLLKALPQAIQGSRVAVLLTVPMRIVGATTEVERLYADMENRLKELYEALRHQYRVISPMRLEDKKSPEGMILEENEVVRILRKRVFGRASPELPQRYLLELREHYDRAYSEDMFPQEARDIDSHLKYYPFHPTYIETILRHVAERGDPGKYQKTRFALTLTRMVVRRLWRTQLDPDFIHVWAIDLEDPGIRNLIDPENRYTVYISKMLEGCGNLSEPELAKLVAKAIFIRTFLYDGLPFSERVYPDRRDLYWIVYDKGLGAELARVRVALEEVIGRPDVSYIVERSNRVFFTRILTIDELVKKTAREIYGREESKVLDRLREIVRGWLVTTGVSHRPFSREHSIILTEKEVKDGLLPEESNIHRVIIYLGTADGRLAGTLIQGYRSYNNTTILIDVPSDDVSKKNLEDLKQRVATMIACDRLKKELEQMFPEEEIRNINNERLKNIEKWAAKNIDKLVMDTFKRVWYPGDNIPRNAINTEPVRSLLALALAVLVKEQKLLDPDRVDLNVFLDELRKAGCDLMKEPKQFSSISEVFLMNPRLYLADKDMVSRALERFYRDLDLAVYRDRVYWKRIYKPGEEPSPRDSPADMSLDGLKEGDSIAFWNVYSEMFINHLLETEGEVIEPDRVVRKFYVLRTKSGEERIRDLAIKHREELPLMLKDPKNTLHLVVETISMGFYIGVKPSTVEAKPRSPIEVEVDVKPVGGFRDEVRLHVDHGHLEPSIGTPPFRALWSLTAEEAEGIYTYTVTGASRSLKTDARISVKVFGEWEILKFPIAEYNPLAGDIIKGFEDLDSLEVVSILANRFQWIGDLKLGLEVTGSPKSGGKVEMRLDDVVYGEAEALIQSLDHLVKRDVKASLDFKEEKPLNDADLKRVMAVLRGFSLPSRRGVVVIKRRRRR